MKTITKKPKYFRANTSVKRIDIDTKECFDKQAGNSYFSAVITINDKYQILLPFQYGYNGGQQETIEVLNKLNMINTFSNYDLMYTHNIKISEYKQDNCLKRDVIQHGEL